MKTAPPLALRAATPSDAEEVAALWEAGWHDGHRGHVPAELHLHRRTGDFRRRAAERLADTVVATVDGQVAGFVMIHDDEIEQIYVGAEARGHGVADALLRYGEALIAAEHDRAWLAVVDGNARARRFYERNGWRDAGPFDYHAATATGSIPVPSRRYQKSLVRP